MKFILFGATGDLARTRLVPQLQRLYTDGKLPSNFELVAVGRRPLSNIDYANLVGIPTASDFTYKYVQVDFESSNGFRPLFEYVYKDTTSSRIFYFSLGPEPMMQAIERFCDDESCRILKHENSIVATEKPFGSSLQTAKELNRRLLGIAHEDQIYRVDHYLQKDTTKRILDYRKQYGLIGDFWQRVAGINIVASEQITVGARAAYYDSEGGAINDWIQNHLLGLLALTITPELDVSCYDCRTQALSSLVADTSNLVLGQYLGYQSEPGVKLNSRTETYAKLTLGSNLPFLEGKPITLVSGKGLASKFVAIQITLHSGEVITLEIDPGGKDKELGEQKQDAFYNVLQSLTQAQRDYFVSSSEILAQWKIVDPVNSNKQQVNLISYPIGTPYDQI